MDDKTYVLRTKNWTYLHGYGDTPVLSGQHRPSFLATYLLVGIVCAFVFAVMHTREEDAAETRLARDGATTQGVITAVQPIYRGKTSGVEYYRVDFRFTVPAGDGRGETTYTGIGRTRDRELPTALRYDTPIVVRYVPDAPELAQAWSPPLLRGATTLQLDRGERILAIPLLFYPPRLIAWWWVWRRERHLTRHGRLLRAEIVDMRRGGWGWWERTVVTYHVRTPEGESVTGQARIEYARAAKPEAKGAVLYLDRKRHALL